MGESVVHKTMQTYLNVHTHMHMYTHIDTHMHAHRHMCTFNNTALTHITTHIYRN